MSEELLKKIEEHQDCCLICTKEGQCQQVGYCQREVLRLRKKQPAINTFEELAEKLGFEDVEDKFYLTIGVAELGIYRDGFIYLVDNGYLSETPLTKATPQQAYNIITALKDNLGG